MRLYFTTLILCPIFLSACATTYNPAEVCTVTWIKPRVERALSEIENDTNSFVRTLKKSADSFENGQTPGPFQVLRLTNAASKFMDEIQNGRGIKDLRILRDTCNEPELVEDAMRDFLQDQGLPAGMIGFIEDLDIYQSLIEDSANPAS